MFADPNKILQNFGIGENMIVADLGAGVGFYAIPIAKIARGGKVYAVEVQKELLTTLKNNAENAGAKNVECIWGDIETPGGTKIKDSLADVVVLSNILFLAQDKRKMVKEAGRILKKGGRLLFIDWSDASSIVGPKSEMLVKPAKARELLEGEGFHFDRDIPAGVHHYGMIFIKK